MGLGLSPSSVQHLTETFRPFSSPSTTAMVAGAEEEEGKRSSGLRLEIVVVRAWDLPECLGGTNAYVLVQVGGSVERRETAVQQDSLSPFFGAIFTWPLSDSSSTIQFSLFNRNYSLADELLGFAEAKLDQSSDSLILQLSSLTGQLSGFLEVQLRLVG